jgi:hypothetical protein
MIYLIVMMLLYILYLRRNKSLFSPDAVYFLAWLLPFSLLALNLIDYDELYTSYSIYLILTLSICYCFGWYGLGLYFRGGVSPRDLGWRPKSITRYFILGFVAIYSICLLIEIVQNLDGFNLQDARDEHWNEVGEAGGRTAIASLIYYLKPLGMLLGVSFPYFFMKKMRVFGVACGLMLSMLVINSLFTGGRFLLVYQGIVSFLVYFLVLEFDKGRQFKVRDLVPKITFKNTAATIALLGGIYFLFVVFPVSRNPDLASYYADFLIDYVAAAKFSFITEVLVSLFGISIKVLVFSTNYLSGVISNFTFFVSDGEIFDMHIGGGYSFPFMYAKITSSNVFWDVRDQIATIRSSSGLAINPWSTAFRDYIIDFGVYGAGIFVFILGCLSRVVKSNFTRCPGYLNTIFYASVLAYILFIPFLNIYVMNEVFMFNMLVLLLLLSRKVTLYMPRKRRF